MRRKTLTRRLLCAGVAVPIFLAIYFLAFWLRFDGQLAASHLRTLGVTAGFVVAIKLVAFARFRLLRGWSRYITFHELVILVKAASVSSLFVMLGDYLLLRSYELPRSVVVMDWGMTIFLLGGLRSLVRLVKEGHLPGYRSADQIPVLIAGTNDSGEALLRAIRQNPKLKYRVEGFISEFPAAVGQDMGGVPVLGILDDTCELAVRHGATEVLITAGELAGSQVRRLVDEGREYGVAVKVLPSYEQLLHGTVDLRPRTVSIEDLLRREPVKLDMQELHDWIDGHVLLVTGSAGSIGSEICRQLLQFSPQKLILVDRSENGQFFLERELRELAPGADIEVCMADITDAPRMRHVFKQHQPDIVFHAAAYKHVPLMEANPGEAVKNIVLATRQLADLTDQHQVKSFVMISTDKAVNPTSVMGACKRVAELYVQSLDEQSDCRFVTVRFGNVLDSAASVVPIFREQIARGGPVTVTHPDMRRYFMTIPEASQLVIQAGAMGNGGEIFVLDMGQPVRIIDLAKDMIRLSGLRVGDDVAIAFSGIRQGEKLFEELHVDGERHLSTSHMKIMVAQGDRMEMAEVLRALERLSGAAETSPQSVPQELSRIVPQYQRPDSAGQIEELTWRRAA